MHFMRIQATSKIAIEWHSETDPAGYWRVYHEGLYIGTISECNIDHNSHYFVNIKDGSGDQRARYHPSFLDALNSVYYLTLPPAGYAYATNPKNQKR